jgi:hypothetical protein
LRAYHRDGYLVVSGLLSPQIAERAERTMWALCGLDPKAPPESWLQWGPPAPEVAAAEKVSWHPRNDVSSYMKHEEDRGNLQTNGLQNADLMACATPRYLGAMAQLLGVPPDEMHPPQAVHTQNLLPRPGAERGEVRPHVDGIPKEHNHSTFPGPFNITSLLFMNDTQGEEGGGTRVWPGSASKILALAESDREKYEKLWRLVQDVPKLELDEPVQLIPNRGDVLFWSHLLGHNGTPNTGTVPRLCLRFFCSCEDCFARWKKTEEWGHWAPYGPGRQGPFGE